MRRVGLGGERLNGVGLEAQPTVHGEGVLEMRGRRGRRNG